jgi:cytochrome oxidase Cu insertion factor (SCO1/SenC/PrrC family)
MTRMLTALAASVLLGVVATAPLAQAPERSAAELMDAVMWNREPIGGPFALTDQHGRRRTDADFRGRLMLVYFGYTFCPDICPLGLTTVSDAIDRLPAEIQDEVVPLFITVDPARDTVEVMREYVGSFSPRLIGLTGNEAAIASTLRAYRVYARKSDAETGDGRYLVDHSTFTYLMGRDGKYLAHFGHSTTSEEMAKQLEEAVAAG